MRILQLAAEVTPFAKTGGLGETGLTLTDLGLAAKAEIDRIREQSLNIE